MSYRPPRTAPSDRSHLERLVQALSVEEGIAADRLRRWVSAQVLLGALSQDGDDAVSEVRSLIQDTDREGRHGI